MNVENLINSKVRLPSPPAIAIRILDAVRNDDSSFSELAGIIQSDPALAARILRLANSPYYKLSTKIASIEKALAVLGTDVVKNIALSFVISDSMKGATKDAFNFEFFWKRSITAAVAADLVAALIRFRNEDTFVTALLQDIGIVIMHACRPADYLRVLETKATCGLPLHEVERQIFGFDHQEAGAELLKKWNLPESIHQPIRYHHLRDSVHDAYRKQRDVLFLSDRLSAIYHGSQSVDAMLEIRNMLETKFDIRESAVDTLIDDVAGKCIGIFAAFEIDPGGMRPFSQIMQEANDELSNLNLSYEMLVIDLKQAKEKAEKLAHELNEANERLRELAFRDGLTGLFNHRYFQEAMDLELERSLRYGRCFSLILFDIDHFKKINDIHGHLRGDIVLKGLGNALDEFVRSCDVAARYGGEEFAVILTETDLAGAKTMAERLRQSIEQLIFAADGNMIKVTVSIGVTSYSAGARTTGKAMIIDMADKALYISKQSGRNKVSVMRLPGC